MQKNEKCLECGIDFDSKKSLHAHIKSHKMYLGDYYVKHFPKFDLYTKEQLPFKDYNSYFDKDFKTKKNMYKYLQGCSLYEKNKYCKDSLEKYFESNDSIKYAPNYLYFLTHPKLPRIDLIEKDILENAFEKFNLSRVFVKEIDQCPDFKCIPDSLEIFQDTREQTPLIFKGLKNCKLKLDFADYTLGGDAYSYIYVDRKAESDFKSTMSSGFERFCRELERARGFDSYIYIVIESNIKNIYKNNNIKYNKKINLDYIWHNMRKIIAEYSDVCQFIFSGSRENSELIIPYILYHGETMKSCDVQFYLEKYKCLG